MSATVDERARDDPVDLVEAVLEDRDPDRDREERDGERESRLDHAEGAGSEGLGDEVDRSARAGSTAAAKTNHLSCSRSSPVERRKRTTTEAQAAIALPSRPNRMTTRKTAAATDAVRGRARTGCGSPRTAGRASAHGTMRKSRVSEIAACQMTNSPATRREVPGRKEEREQEQHEEPGDPHAVEGDRDRARARERRRCPRVGRTPRTAAASIGRPKIGPVARRSQPIGLSGLPCRDEEADGDEGDGGNGVREARRVGEGVSRRGRCAR